MTLCPWQAEHAHKSIETVIKRTLFRSVSLRRLSLVPLLLLFATLLLAVWWCCDYLTYFGPTLRVIDGG